MAPEQASGDHPLDHRADVWSMGVILYECLAGMRPIEGENLPQVVARLMSAGIMPLERITPELPGEVSALVNQMLTREVSRRPASLLEVSKVLSRYTNVRAPDFEAPSGMSGGAAKTMESARSARPKARVVQSRDADPQGPTMLSSPPVNSSLLHDAKEAPKPRRSLFGLAMIGVLLVAIALLAMERKPPAQSSVSTAELPTLPGPPEKPAITPVGATLPSPPPSGAVPPSAAPTASAAAVPARIGTKHPAPAPKPTSPAPALSSKKKNPFEERW
jgi:serine/threonine-protein kinase